MNNPGDKYPEFIPVINYKGSVNSFIIPYLHLISKGALISYPFLAQLKNNENNNNQHQINKFCEKIAVPLWIDSGSYGYIKYGGTIISNEYFSTLELNFKDEKLKVDPRDLLDLQEKFAQYAFTLDFPVIPEHSENTMEKHLRLSIKNAVYAVQNKRKKNLKLYASVPVVDNLNLFSQELTTLTSFPFDGIALGSLVPRKKDFSFVLEAVKIARKIFPDLPLHLFGFGKPEIMSQLKVDSVDSSTYIRLALSGKDIRGNKIIKQPSHLEQAHLALLNLASLTDHKLPLALNTSLIRFSQNNSKL
ncbi:MAG: tRNA-guanine transglycosylase [Deltaproteobacteria bacterium]|jgi:tRNA-guanine family transglycosylase|nr:tRNA-guanine transglycosylase [Deltaproteobacteria bacterium]